MNNDGSQCHAIAPVGVAGSNSQTECQLKSSAYRNPSSTKSTSDLATKCSQKFVNTLLEKSLASRASGTSSRSIEAYHYTLDNFVGYPLTSEGISSYLNSLTCHNGKAKFYSCLRALSRWLYRNGYIAENIIEKVSPPKTQRKILPAVSKEQLDTLLAHCHCERAKALISFLVN